MHAYGGMDYEKVMRLPMQVFWQLSGFVPRLMADEQKQQLEIWTASQSNEGAEEAFKALNQLAPEPVKLSVRGQIEASAVMDKGGLDQLRNLQG